jgi:hypothetical protein
MNGINTGEYILCLVDNSLKKYGLPFNKFAFIMTHRFPALTRIENGLRGGGVGGDKCHNLHYLIRRRVKK